MADSRVYEQAREFLDKFGTDRAKGLTTERVDENRRRYGTNMLTPPEKDPLWKQYLANFKDPTIIILCVCAAIAMGIGVYRGEMPWDGVAILIAVMLATFGATWSEYKADKAFEMLKKHSDNIPAKVTRNGQFHTISSNKLVVGDLIHIEGGDKIPADSVLIQSVDLMLDESLMTGESDAVHKGAQNPKLIAGTHATIGNGLAIVAATGDNTELGNLASALGKGFVCPERAHLKVYKREGTCDVCGRELEEREEPETPLQETLGGLAGQISVWGTYAAVFIFLALLAAGVFAGNLEMEELSYAWRSGLGYFIGSAIVLGVVLLVTRSPLLTRIALWGGSAAIGGALIIAVILHGAAGHGLDNFKGVLDYFMIAVTIVVVAVPEGLPMAVTIALGFSMRKIRQDNNLVRKLLATETIGCTTVVCTDKTGTLTKNQMEVQEVHLAGKQFQGSDLLATKDWGSFDMLATACAVNSTAEVEHLNGQVRFVGNPTEGALLLWLEREGVSYQEVRSRMPIHSRVCFTADRKMMTTLTGNDECSGCNSCPMEHLGAGMSAVATRQEGCRMVFVKGAPDRVLPLCTDAHVTSDQTRPMAECEEELAAAVETMARRAIRPLAIAYRAHRRAEIPSSDTAARDFEEGLTLLAVVGMSDPVREDVPKALHTCRDAGVEVKMVTGDHAATAEAVAREIGLIETDDVTLRGEEFESKSDEEVVAIMPKLRIISRARPLDKERLVTLLQKQGHVVAVTGDGTNDAPALRSADVGISMGQRGTDVAKEASDIVLTDDNFGSIVRAVHWGRTLYENLQKFLQFQLTVNLSALGVAFLSPILATAFPNVGFQQMPLTVLQYLWINLIMDTLAALAFSLEPRRPETMKMKPRDRKVAFLTPVMLTNILVLGSYFIVLILFLQATDFLGVSKLGPLAVSSVVFNCYVWFQIFHMFNARSVIAGRSAFAGLSKSRSFFFIMGLVIVGQILLVQVGGDILHTEALPLFVWVKIILLGSTALVVGEILRFVQRIVMSREGGVAPATAVN